MTDTPTTAAGARLLASWTDWQDRERLEVAILAIEAEARAQGAAAERERIRAGVEALPTWDKRTVPGGFHVLRAAVRAILDEVSA